MWLSSYAVVVKGSFTYVHMVAVWYLHSICRSFCLLYQMFVCIFVYVLDWDHYKFDLIHYNSQQVYILWSSASQIFPSSASQIFPKNIVSSKVPL